MAGIRIFPEASRTSVALLAFAVMAVGLGAPLAATAGPPRMRHLAPGSLPRLTERVPVNVVFLGIDRDRVDLPAIHGALPKSSEPIVRAPAFYGNTRRLGIRYSYDVDVHFTSGNYEERFFGFLARSGKESPLTQAQHLYNGQAANVLDVKRNIEIPADEVEARLALDPPAGVNTREHTVFLIDWYGRKDFRFHVYGKTGEPTIDKGFDYGMLDHTKTVAWGGTTATDEETGLGATRRVWFYDFSAGPDHFTSNGHVDEPDLDEDGSPDRRIPVSWEYSKKGFKPRSEFSTDVGLLLRYVALDLLFTPSPLYAPRIDEAIGGGRIDLDLNFYNGPGASGASDLVKPRQLIAELNELLEMKISSDEQELVFEEPQHAACYGGFFGAMLDPTPTSSLAPACTGETDYSSWGNLYRHHYSRLSEIVDDADSYEAPSFNYLMDTVTGFCFAYADDDHKTGKQAFVYMFLTKDGACAERLGWTELFIHEYGHHFGMSHPHDGYDFESKRHFSGYEGEFQFAMAGTEVNSVMSYMHTNWDFSQFDHDNYNRWMTASYLDAANDLLAAAVEQDYSIAGGILKDADRVAGDAVDAFASHRYPEARAAAKLAFNLLRRALPGSLPVPSRVSASGDVHSLPLYRKSAVIDVYDEEGIPVRPDLLFTERRSNR